MPGGMPFSRAPALAVVFYAMGLGAESVVAQATITWIDSTRVFACAGTYGRAKRLSDGSLALVYSRGADACLRRAAGATGSWGPETVVARTTGYSNTNAEMIELENGWLLFGWNGRPTAGGAFHVSTKVSRDGGKTWGDEARAYTAGTVAGTGCWEPAFLPADGGVQMYFANEAPYAGTNTDQEIGMLLSQDHGLTWGSYAAVSHRTGARDGMPVPISLADGKGLALVIEDNGLDGKFKPAVLHAGPDGWGTLPVTGKDPRRKAALTGTAGLAADVYAGAPYLIRMPGGISGGATVLSVQSTEGRPASADPVAAAVMRVYVGDANAENFSGGSMPFPGIPATGNGVWNSLAALDDSTVMAVSAIRGLGRDGLWTVIGKLKAGPSPVRARAGRWAGPGAPRGGIDDAAYRNLNGRWSPPAGRTPWVLPVPTPSPSAR
jgi:hypothetical protein